MTKVRVKKTGPMWEVIDGCCRHYFVTFDNAWALALAAARRMRWQSKSMSVGRDNRG